jgi:glucokinase
VAASSGGILDLLHHPDSGIDRQPGAAIRTVIAVHSSPTNGEVGRCGARTLVIELPGRILLGDIGGTNARFALLESGQLTPVESLSVADYPDIREALIDYLGRHGSKHRIEGTMLAVAGPVENDRCVLTNSSWVIDGAALLKTFGLAKVHLINDFEAIAWALPRLAPDDLFAIGGGKSVRSAPAAVLGPGTGLGLAFLLAGPNGAIVVDTEGGHATLPATTLREDAIIEYLRSRFGHVSAERALSGGGLEIVR